MDAAVEAVQAGAASLAMLPLGMVGAVASSVAIGGLAAYSYQRIANGCPMWYVTATTTYVGL